ncbi:MULTISPECIES: hypothetical protein [Streptomyces violaceusniger group]|uniref:Uncharacterized protein n=1 Tax=Streptomyces antimycoticus TaxID=68175 RepID=A0ABD5JGH2_9ACTN|nr:hypothetical protein [Streptomyces violaceusniger]MEE4587505.1 hypothetical protein [Streptomyces sp. DSM 41602]
MKYSTGPFDDAEAAAIADLLREEARIQKSAPEVKFQKMFTAGGVGMATEPRVM